jgi:hypothetical protein
MNGNTKFVVHTKMIPVQLMNWSSQCPFRKGIAINHGRIKFKKTETGSYTPISLTLKCEMITETGMAGRSMTKVKM